MKRTKSLLYHQSLQFALVAALPVLIIAILVGLFLLPAMRSDTGIRHQAMAQSVAGQVSSHLLDGQRQLVALAQFLGTRDALSAWQLTALLDSQCGEGELFETIYLSSPRKQVVTAVGLARSRRSIRKDLLGLDLSGRAFLMEAGNPQEPAWSETFMSTVNRRLAVALTIPLSDNRITAEITLDNLSAVISQLPMEAGLLTYVIDRRGRIVADSRRLHLGQRLNAALPCLAGPGDRGPSSPGFFELDGESFLGTVVSIDKLGWTVLVAQPVANAYKTLRTTLLTFVMGLVFAIMLALSLSWNRAKRLSRIFQAYGEKAGAIAGGRYDETWPSSTITELDRMGQSLKHMAGMIDQREKALVENEERLRNLVSNVPGVVYQYKSDPDSVAAGKMTDIVREKMLEIFGVDSESENFHHSFAACIPEQDRSCFEMSILDAVKAEKPWHYEGLFTTPAGEPIWFEGNSVPRRIGDDLIYYGVLADITERKEMESALRLTQFIYDKAPIGIWRMGNGGEILDVNEQGCSSLGYTREELCRMKVFDFDPDQNHERWERGLAELEKVGATVIESLHQRRSGEIFPIQVTQNRMRYEDQVLHVAFVQDITERKRNEEELRQNYMQLKTVYNTLPIIIWAVDKDGVFTMSEGKDLGGLGLKPGKVVGRSLFDLYKDDPMILEHAKRALKGQSCEYGLNMMGNYYHVMLMPFFDDKSQVQGINGLSINVTEKRKAEEEIRQLRNYLSNIIDSMPSVLVGVDREGRVTQWNKQAERVTGLASGQVTDKPLEAVFAHLAGQMVAIQTAIQECRVISASKVPCRRDKETRFEDITIFPLMADGVEGAVIRVDDVTEQVRLEEMMIQSEKMLSVGGLAAGMAHEVNNPLAGILQNASVLENRLLGDLPTNHRAAEAAGTSMEAIRKYLDLRKLPGMIENIRESGSRAAAIVRNMLSFARKSDRRVSTHDLGKLLDQTVVLVQTDYDMKKHYDVKQIRIEREYDPVAPPVPCEAGKVQQVFMNILKNGAEAMAEVPDAESPPAFALRVKDDANWVRVEIEDNGPGMDEATRRRIFEPFFTTKPAGQGTGLGLSVSYFIITEDHGGEMGVQAVEGGGTCFLMRLPKGGR